MHAYLEGPEVIGSSQLVVSSASYSRYMVFVKIVIILEAISFWFLRNYRQQCNYKNVHSDQKNLRYYIYSKRSEKAQIKLLQAIER